VCGAFSLDEDNFHLDGGGRQPLPDIPIGWARQNGRNQQDGANPERRQFRTAPIPKSADPKSATAKGERGRAPFSSSGISRRSG
jgi:hypothetical protein